MFDLFKAIPTVTPEESFKALTSSRATLIDVRTEEEYADGHAKGAQSIPLDRLSDDHASLVSASEVYVICRTGGRSAQAVRFLVSKGVNAQNVRGGTLAWAHAGLPME